VEIQLALSPVLPIQADPGKRLWWAIRLKEEQEPEASEQKHPAFNMLRVLDQRRKQECVVGTDSLPYLNDEVEAGPPGGSCARLDMDRCMRC